MENELQEYKKKTFEDIKHIDERRLGYTKLGNFKKVIDKAKISCRVSGDSVDDCFTVVKVV